MYFGAVQPVEGHLSDNALEPQIAAGIQLPAEGEYRCWSRFHNYLMELTLSIFITLCSMHRSQRRTSKYKYVRPSILTKRRSPPMSLNMESSFDFNHEREYILTDLENEKRPNGMSIIKHSTAELACYTCARYCFY